MAPTLLHCVCEKRVGAPTADGGHAIQNSNWGYVFWSTVTPTLLHCGLEKRVGAPTADGGMSSRILIGAMLLEHCDTNIAALCS